MVREHETSEGRVVARLLRDHRTGLLTKVAWTEYTPPDGERTSRTKQLDTEEQAQLFLALVERNDERMPSFTTLQRFGLPLEFGYTINPEFIMGLRRIVLDDEMPNDRKIQLLRYALEDF
jgi:hypothetical protein